MHRQRKTKDRPATAERTVTAHLRDLEHRARHPARLEGREREESHYETPIIDDESFVVHSNLESSDVTQNLNKKGHHLPTWDFSQQLQKILGADLNGHSPHSDSYKVPLGDETFLDSLESAFPPKQYIIHLAHVVDFHVNTNYCLFNITVFIDQLNKVAPDTISGAFKVKLSLIVALGRLFLEKGATVSGPPGITDFLRGVRDFKPHTMTDEDPSIAVECLCLLATYAQAADMHRMAYLYIGQASRIARAWKLDCGDGDIMTIGIKHTQKLWLTVCTLDQRLSATIGVSPDTGSTEQPFVSSYFNDASNIEIPLNLEIANILTRVVKVLSQHQIEDALTSSFVGKISTELTYLQSLVEHMKNIQPLCSTPSLLTTSRQVATLHLQFYHCIMVATRPVLLCLLKRGLQEPVSIIEESVSFETLFKIMQTCINAANCTLSIISALYEQNLLETFMFLDMEMTFQASLCLILGNKIFPKATESYYIPLAEKVLQYMCHTGSIPAGLLQKELSFLHGLIADHNILSFHQLFGRNSSFWVDNNFLDKRLSMIQVGLDLTNAILGVIEIPSLNGFSAENAPESSLQATRTELNNNSISHEYQMDGIDPVDTSFSFDMADLQWLDCVQ
ncbi:uncharacterized protein TRUGW13939_09011 [Talaromyces rugulosus]|uniref:Transcription factor domain-containing protein n=1 Tax=Talaromyces rugulosus TaxID=121627 RepID=A0A7H8R8B3_TALRU|nr:uncharacterized protein TRUGW13939_09011 [Talaromyces rugulosus]QKX61855.1 hypothetical protein TRUGW13939_09011 [Talaromyces rugulosus]